MREIKFRGKRIDNGEWIYGDLVTMYGGGCCKILDFKSISEQYLFDVDPSTVGQLKENGMYEGDILKSPFGICILRLGEYTEQVKEYVHGVLTTIHPCGWYFEYTSGETVGWDWQYSPGYFKKIGNIHDNPELMAK